MRNTPIHLFVLGMPYSGTTMLWKLIGTSPNATTFPTEGQAVPEALPLMRTDRWNPEQDFSWPEIRRAWESHWDAEKPIRLEKSPPNMLRARQLEAHFENACFVLLMREPYAFVEGFARRKKNTTHRIAAQRWVEWAYLQRDNLANLKSTLLLRYEDICASPAMAVQQLMQFEPLLKSLKADITFRCHSVVGSRDGPIVNFNALKRELLSANARRVVYDVLAAHRDLLAEFGYAAEFPTRQERKPALTWFEKTRFQLRRVA